MNSTTFYRPLTTNPIHWSMPQVRLNEPCPLIIMDPRIFRFEGGIIICQVGSAEPPQNIVFQEEEKNLVVVVGGGKKHVVGQRW